MFYIRKTYYGNWTVDIGESTFWFDSWEDAMEWSTDKYNQFVYTDSFYS